MRLNLVVPMHAAAAAGAYLCSETGTATAETTAQATATLFAEAVARASVFCEGDTPKASVLATQAAEDWLEAYAEAFAQSSVCNTCESTVSSWGYVAKYVFLEAVASASAIVRLPHLLPSSEKMPKLCSA
jgi:hypothetical protein